MLKIGVLGTGHLGKIHMKCIGLVDDWQLVGFYDPNAEVSAKVAADFGLKAFESVDALLEACDAVDIVTPTPTHYELAKKAIQAKKHVFIEKPVTETVEQANELLLLQKEHGVKVQIGHVERFNPAYIALEGVELNPMFIEGHRLATFNPRGTDVSVVLDLMIHDLDLILQMVKSEVKEVKANGVKVVSETDDICNARIEFENGAVANLTASRISMKQMRKIRMFQSNAYMSVDLLEKEAQIIEMSDESMAQEGVIEFPLETPKGQKFIKISAPTVQPNNAIQNELQTFYNAASGKDDTPVTLAHGHAALKLARLIMDISEKN